MIISQRIRYEKCNATLIEKFQIYQYYYLAEPINMNMLQRRNITS